MTKHLDNYDLLRKALQTSDLSSGGGLLNPKQANRFIDMAMADNVLLTEARTERMDSPKQHIDKIGFEQRIMVPATEATDPGAGGESDPSTDRVTLSTEEGIAIVKVSYSALEDNVERAQMGDRIVRQMAARAGLDVAEQALHGDEAGAGGDAWLEANTGFFALATSNVIDAKVDATDASDVLENFDLAYRALPKRFVNGSKRAWRFYVHEDAEYNMRVALSERATGAGDRFLTDDAPILLRGIPVVALPSIASFDDAGTERAHGLLCHPANLIIGIQRQISIESDRDIRARVVEYVVTLRNDFAFEEEQAVVKVENLAL